MVELRPSVLKIKHYLPLVLMIKTFSARTTVVIDRPLLLVSLKLRA